MVWRINSHGMTLQQHAKPRPLWSQQGAVAQAKVASRFACDRCGSVVCPQNDHCTRCRCSHAEGGGAEKIVIVPVEYMKAGHVPDFGSYLMTPHRRGSGFVPLMHQQRDGVLSKKLPWCCPGKTSYGVTALLRTGFIVDSPCGVPCHTQCMTEVNT